METDLNKLRDRAYKCACDHGFHEKELSYEHYLMLIITEISEAVNADRKGINADIEAFKSLEISQSDNWEWNFKYCIKDSVEDEIADVAIRLLDFAGEKKVNLNGIVVFSYVVSKNKSFPENMYAIVKDITNYKYSTEELVNYAIRQIFKVAEFMGINLLKYIELKMKYNELRPYKNGKKY